MKTIVAIGGAVIKTALKEIKDAARLGLIDVLIHNGGSIFHDFQLATEKLDGHSYPLDRLLNDFECNRGASNLVWEWLLKDGEAPKGSLTDLLQRKEKPVLMFTALGCDFWQLFTDSNKRNWGLIGTKAWFDFQTLCREMESPFHFISMGSAVIMPEVFTKALAVVKPKNFRADVVDFLEIYRPRTRVARYGKYFQMDHRRFLRKWIDGEIYPVGRELNGFQFQEATADG